jgi:hypothetical protein
MSVFSGPEINNDDLVFYYDMGNPQKSWKGAPTTNLYSALVGTNLNSYNGWSMPGVPGAASQIVTNYGSWDGNTIWRVTVGVGTIPSFASWRQCLPANYDSIYGTTRRLIAKVKMLKGSISNLGSHNGGGTGGATYTAIDPSAVSHTINDKTGWFLLDLNVSGSYPSGHCVGIGILAQDIEFLVAEMGVYPSSSFVPYTPTSRSNTQAILDLTNNNTVTANSLTYATDGTFSFNGTTDFVNAGNTFTFAQSSQFSAEVWLKILDHSDRPAAAAGIIGKGHYYNNQWDIWLYNNNSIYFETSGNPTRQGLVYLASPVLTLNTWHHYVATYNNGAKSIYLNGNLVGTQTYTGPGDFSNTNNVLIGRRFNDASRSLRGSVSVAKIYNRALSAAEVQQNFNALRGRYGI